VRRPWGHERMTRLFVAAAAVVFALAVGSVRSLRAQVTGTAGFETGLQQVTTVDLDRFAAVTVYWGDGSSSPGLLNCHYVDLSKCDIWGTHVYASPMEYSISISYSIPLCLFDCGASASATAIISSPGNFVILTIGDSVASGEGNPDVNLDTPDSVNEAYWDDGVSDYTPTANQPCHRSSKAGFVEAQQEVQANNPAITTINYACSGDTVQQTIDALRSARAMLPRVDVLLVSVGADNVDGGFSKLAETCILNNPTTPCSEDSTFTSNTDKSIKNLSACNEVSEPSCYPNLAREINCINPDTGMQDCTDPQMQIPKLVLITEYFDPTHNQNGQFPTLLGDPGCIAGVTAVTVDEWSYLYNSVVLPLNQQVRSFPSLASAAGLAVPAYVVTGIQNDFLDHGYCAGDPFGERWVNNLADDTAIQGIPEGVVHPNAAGQADYKSRIYNAIVAYNPPVTTAAATAGGSPYTFGTWTTHDVTVTLSATNAIKESGVGATFYGVDNATCASADPAGCLTYGGPFMIATSGKHTVTFFSKNAHGYPEEVQSVQVWVDNEPPAMTCTATPPALWPPNNKMAPVRLNVTAVSIAFGPTPISLKSVGTSEGNAATDIQGFVIGQPSTEGSLRASRQGYGMAGRVYTFVYQSTDELGLTGTCTAEVLVPHDQRRSNR
jgi:lysophospholipase L1-like esterase